MASRLMMLAASMLCLPALLSAQSISDNGAVPFNSAVKVVKTKNGIPFYYLHNTKPAKRLELILTVNAGAVLEDIDQYGLAHFCEHMAFNGTKDFPKQELVSFLESTGIRFGADLNAYTNYDETVYMLTVPTDDTKTLINGIKVLRDWAAYVNYTTEDINEERGVVTEEWRLNRGANDRVFEKHRAAMFNNSAYATHDVIGDTTTLLHGSPDALRRFYHKWYTPENFSIIVVGDVEYEAIHDIVLKYFQFGTETGNVGTPRPTIQIANNPELQISIASDPELQTAEFEMTTRHAADTVRTYADYRKKITEQLATTMLNARLAEIAQKAEPPFAGARVGGTRIARQYEGMYTSTVASGKNVMIAANALLTELQRARKHGFTETELKRAKDQQLAMMEQYYNERDKTQSMQLAMELMRHVLQAESVPGIVHETEIYRHYIPLITADDCKAALVEALSDGNNVVMISVPDVAGYVKPTEKQVRDLMAAVSTKMVEPYVDNVPVGPLLATAPKAGEIKDTKVDKEFGVKTLTLSNGAKVILKKTDFQNDEILFKAESYGGQSLGNEKDHVTLSTAAEIVDASGIASFDTPTLTKMLAGKTLTITPYIRMEQHGLSGSTSPKDLKTFFELVHLYFTQPRIDSSAIASWKTKTKAMLENRGSNPQAALMDSITVTLTNHHPRRTPLTAEALDNINPQLALDFFKKLFSNASNFTFTIVGNFDEAEMESMLKTYVAGLPSAAGKSTWKDVGVRTVKGKIDKTVYKGSEPQSFVLMDISGPIEYDAKHRYDVSALTEVMNIRLREKLREQASGVYFVSVQPQMERIPVEYLNELIIFTCNPDRVDELTNMALKELDTLAMKPVDESYITKVREIQLKEREVAAKTNGYWLRSLSTLAADNEPFSLISKREEYIKALTAKQVMEAAKTYLNTGNYARFTLKPEVK